MSAKPGLTPFPDGCGYMEYAWSSLSSRQRQALMGVPHKILHVATLRALRRQALVRDVGTRLTDRGEALASWARATGRWSL